MPKFDDRTMMGGSRSSFNTTSWTMILNSQTSDKELQRLIINDLLSRYWKPVYCYLRHKGYDNDMAKDLTQGFFHEVVLGRNLIQQADRKQGKFRTFLLTSLDRYVVDVHRQETAGKRQPKGQMLSWEDYDLPEVPQISPEQGFNYAWVSELLDQVLSEVKQECHKTSKQVHWQVFCGRLLNPIMDGTKPVPLPQLCSKYGIESESNASNMVITVKRRLRKALERQIERLDQSDLEVDKEIYELISIFSKK